MTYSLFYSLLLSVLVLLMLSSCGSSGNPTDAAAGGGENTFTVNGAGMNNKTYTDPPPPSDSTYNPFAFGAFDRDNNITAVVNIGVAAGDTLVVVLVFSGDQTGSFRGPDTPRIISLAPPDTNRFIFGGGYGMSAPWSAVPANTEFNLNVTRYGAVGERIQGSYTATLREVKNGRFGSTTVTVTGNFNVVRLSDGFPNFPW